MLVLAEVRLLAVHHLIGVAETCCRSVHDGRRYHHISFRLSCSVFLTLSLSLSLPRRSSFGSKDSLYSSMRGRDREGGWVGPQEGSVRYVLHERKGRWGNEYIRWKLGDASQDFEEFVVVVAKVEQPA